MKLVTSFKSLVVYGDSVQCPRMMLQRFEIHCMGSISSLVFYMFFRTLSIPQFSISSSLLYQFVSILSVLWFFYQFLSSLSVLQFLSVPQEFYHFFSFQSASLYSIGSLVLFQFFSTHPVPQFSISSLVPCGQKLKNYLWIVLSHLAVETNRSSSKHHHRVTGSFFYYERFSIHAWFELTVVLINQPWTL